LTGILDFFISGSEHTVLIVETPKFEMLAFSFFSLTLFSCSHLFAELHHTTAEKNAKQYMRKIWEKDSVWKGWVTFYCRGVHRKSFSQCHAQLPFAKSKAGEVSWLNFSPFFIRRLNIRSNMGEVSGNIIFDFIWSPSRQSQYTFNVQQKYLI